MTPDTKHGASFGAASTTQELAEALKHINRAITSPRENGTLLAASERLLELESRLKHMAEASTETSAHLIRAGIPAFGWNHEGVDKLAAERDAWKQAAEHLRLCAEPQPPARGGVKCNHQSGMCIHIERCPEAGRCLTSAHIAGGYTPQPGDC